VVEIPNIEKFNTLRFYPAVVSTDILDDMCNKEIQFALADQCVSKANSQVGSGTINYFLFKPSL
jgi:hypothetical protein